MFIFTIFIILTIFTLDLTLSILNYKHRKQPIPENVSDIYDQVEYDKWLSYTMEGFRLDIISKIFTTFVLLSFLILGIFNRLADIANQFSEDKIIQTLLFLGLYGAISYILGIGFSIYRTFNIEERYGFNKTTVKTFIMDQLKSTLLTIILGGGLMYAILYLYVTLGFKAVFYAWALLMTVILLLNILYTKVLLNSLTS